VQAAKKTASKEQKAQTKAAHKGLPTVAMHYLCVLRGGGGVGKKFALGFDLCLYVSTRILECSYTHWRTGEGMICILASMCARV